MAKSYFIKPNECPEHCYCEEAKHKGKKHNRCCNCGHRTLITTVDPDTVARQAAPPPGGWHSHSINPSYPLYTFTTSATTNTSTNNVP